MQLRPNCLVNDNNSQASVRHPGLHGVSGGGEEKGGEWGAGGQHTTSTSTLLFIYLFSPSFLSIRAFSPSPSSVLLPRCLFFAPNSHSLRPSLPPHAPPALPFPSIRLPFLRLCVLRKKLIMFLISRVFQSPSKRDERETGRQETEVAVVVGEGGG